MDCPDCGLPLVYDEIDGEPLVWCPKCGRDYTYAYYENEINTQSARAQREPGGDEIPSIRRD